MDRPDPPVSRHRYVRSPGSTIDEEEQGPSTDDDRDLRLLVVEADPELTHLLEVVLDEPDRTIVAVGSCEAAREAIDRASPDLIVLDLVLPDGDGRGLLGELRRRPRTADIPVLMLSSRTSDRITSECFALGADAVFEKPFEPQTVVAAVASRLSRATSAELDPETDPRTGLLNRSGIVRAVEERATPLGVGLIALDHFERLAVDQGWRVADEVVSAAADALAEALQGSAVILGRWEGPEFCVLLDEGADDGPALLRTAVDAVRTRDIEGPDGETFRVTCSAGWYPPTGDALDFEQRLERARSRLWQAREAGGNRVATSAAEAPGSGERPLVLVAEDDDLTARLLEHRLEREGLRVDRHANGTEAYEAALRVTPALVILDVKMPGMDGFDLLARLRKVPAYAGTPVIMLTSMGNEADLIRGFDLGADDYMLKPFSPVELMARVRRLLHER